MKLQAGLEVGSTVKEVLCPANQKWESNIWFNRANRWNLMKEIKD